MPIKHVLTVLGALIASLGAMVVDRGTLAEGSPIRVLSRDEQQPAQAKAYDHFLGGAIIPRKVLPNAIQWMETASQRKEQVGKSEVGVVKTLADPFAQIRAIQALSLIMYEKPSETPFYVGTYTGPNSKGIHLVRLSTVNGTLSAPELVGEATNPSFLWISPDRRFLYAAGETDEFAGKKSGAVDAFAIDPVTLKLSLLNQQPAGGPGTCFVSVDQTGKCAFVANYGGGSFESLPIGDDGKLSQPATFIQDGVPGQKPDPHGHSIFVSPDNRFALASDLGVDQLFVYKLDSATSKLMPNDPPSFHTEIGFGPRHFAFHPNGKLVFLIGEYGCRILSLKWDAEKGVLTQLDAASTLPDGYKGTNSCAEVVVHPKGKFVYGSNRGLDEIVAFKLDEPTGKLSFVSRVKSAGKTPRNFAIDPSGQFLIAANQDSDNLVSFRVNQETGELTATGSSVQVSKAVCIRFFTPGR